MKGLIDELREAEAEADNVSKLYDKRLGYYLSNSPELEDVDCKIHKFILNEQTVLNRYIWEHFRGRNAKNADTKFCASINAYLAFLENVEKSDKRDLVKYAGSEAASCHWANGKAGQFKDFDGNCLYRFCETDKHCSSYLLREREQRSLPATACGFTAWLLKHWGEETEAIFSGYLSAQVNMYKEAHRNSADSWKRSLEAEFFSKHKEQESSLVKQSEAINEFLISDEVSLLQSYADAYFEYVDSKASAAVSSKVEATKQPAHFTLQFATGEAQRLLENLIKGGFLPKGTAYSHFLYVFGCGAIPDKEMPFKPLQWTGTLKELHYFISKHLPKETNQWEKAVKCFCQNGKPINKNSLATALDKYDNPPESSTTIDNILN
jgi:hypothetical protein